MTSAAPVRTLSAVRSPARADLRELGSHWLGEVTSRRTPGLRVDLYDLLETRGITTVRLFVDRVTAIDDSGIALLVGANDRAAAAGLVFVLIDRGGPVTQALARMHLLDRFLITQPTGQA